MAKKKILIVEDEQKIARFLELELKYEGYDVTIANNGREGFEQGKSPDIDLIILDLMLPGLSGIEVCTTTSTASILQSCNIQQTTS